VNTVILPGVWCGKKDPSVKLLLVVRISGIDPCTTRTRQR